jgi:type I restriction enzyme, S subunit
LDFDYPLPERWRWTQLGELADTKGRAIVSGPFGSNISSKFFVEDGVPVIRGSNLTTGAQKFVDDGFVFVTPEKAKELGNVDAVRDDIVLTAAGSLGQVGIIPDKTRFPLYIISNKQMRVRLNRELTDPLFAFQWLSSPAVVEYIQRQNTGSSVPLINLSIVRRIPVALPPLAEQKAIAAVIGALDDKIELNRRMNATLEAMARALFQSWFVDFDPVRTKLDGHEPVALDSASAALFPEHFAHGEHDKIPVGWRLASIKDVSAINAWTLGKNDDLETLEYVEISEVSRGNIANIATYPRGEEPSRARRRLRHGDTVLSTVRPDRGSYFLVLKPPENRVASTGFAVLTPTKVPWSFLHAALTQPEVSDHLGQMADGGAYPAVRPEVIGAIQVAMPNEPKTLEAFHRLCAPLFEQAEANRTQSRTLATLRDALLPKLLSGELSIKEPNAAAS